MIGTILSELLALPDDELPVSVLDGQLVVEITRANGARSMRLSQPGRYPTPHTIAEARHAIESTGIVPHAITQRMEPSGEHNGARWSVWLSWPSAPQPLPDAPRLDAQSLVEAGEQLLIAAAGKDRRVMLSTTLLDLVANRLITTGRALAECEVNARLEQVQVFERCAQSARDAGGNPDTVAAIVAAIHAAKAQWLAYNEGS